MSFLFSWISSKFPCYLLKYCVSHELLSRLRHGSLCCCPLLGCRKLADHTFVLLTVCVILILNHHQLKKAAQPKFTLSNLGPLLGQCTQAPYKTPGQSEGEGGRREGRRGRERSTPAISESLLGEASLSTVYTSSLRQAGTSPKLGKGEEFGHPPNNLSS